MRPQHPIIDGERECAKCKKMLPVSAFSRLTKSATGFDYNCRGCRRSGNNDAYARQAIRVSDVRQLVRLLIEEKSFTFVGREQTAS